MLYYLLVFVIVEVVVGVLGFGHIAGDMARLARWLFLIFMVLLGVAPLWRRRSRSI